MGKTTEELVAEDNNNGVPEDLLPCEPDHQIEPYEDATEVDEQS